MDLIAPSDGPLRKVDKDKYFKSSSTSPTAATLGMGETPEYSIGRLAFISERTIDQPIDPLYATGTYTSEYGISSTVMNIRRNAGMQYTHS